MKVVRLSALHTGCLYPPGSIPDTHFCSRLSQPQGHSAARRFMSMKNSSGIIGNWTHNLLACSTVPQPTAPPHILIYHYKNLYKHKVYHHRICFYINSLFCLCCQSLQCILTGCIHIYIYIYIYICTNENIEFMSVLLYIIVIVGAGIP
jgi:hypothetical protein